MKKNLSAKSMIIIIISSLLVFNILLYGAIYIGIVSKVMNKMQLTNIVGSIYTEDYGVYTISKLEGDIYIPEAVEKIEFDSKSYINKAKSISVSEKNKTYFSKNNCVFEKKTGKLVLGCVNSILTNDVTVVEQYAFKNLVSAENPCLMFKGTIQEYLRIKNVGINVSKNFYNILFYNKTKDSYEPLETLDIYFNINEISNYTFANFKNLKEVKIGTSVTRIGEYAFFNCANLKTLYIPTSVKAMGGGMLYGCDSLTTLTIPFTMYKNVGYLKWLYTNSNDFASRALINIKDLTVLGGEKIDVSSFSYITSLENVVLGKDVTYIDASAFKDCTNLKSIRIESKLIDIEYSSFAGVKLESVYYPDTESKFMMLFSQSNNLVNYPSPNKYYKIVDTQDILMELLEIDYDGYMNCNIIQYASHYDSICIYKNVKGFSNNYFENCTHIVNVYYEGTETQWNSVFGNNYNYSDPMTFAKNLYCKNSSGEYVLVLSK